MHKFTDNAGREWSVELNTSVLKRVRSLTGVDLWGAGDVPVWKICADPVMLCDVLFAVCKPEADAKNVSDEDFGRAMAGDAIDHATKALLGAIVDFLPTPKERENLQAVVETMFRAQDAERDVIAAKLNSGELAKAIEQELEDARESALSVLSSAGQPEATA